MKQVADQINNKIIYLRSFKKERKNLIRRITTNYFFIFFQIGNSKEGNDRGDKGNSNHLNSQNICIHNKLSCTKNNKFYL